MKWDGRTQVELAVWKPSLEVASGIEPGAMKLHRNSKTVPLVYANRHLAVEGALAGRVYSIHGVVHVMAKVLASGGGYSLIGREVFTWTVNAQQMRIVTHTSPRLDKVLPRLDEPTTLFDKDVSFNVARELIVEQLERFSNPLVAELVWLQFKPALRQAWTNAHELLHFGEWDGPHAADALTVAENWNWKTLTLLPEDLGVEV